LFDDVVFAEDSGYFTSGFFIIDAFGSRQKFPGFRGGIRKVLKHPFLYVFAFAYVEEVVVLAEKIVYTAGFWDAVHIVDVDGTRQFAQFYALVDLVGEISVVLVGVD